MRVVYAIPLSHISDIRELEFIDRELRISNIHGKVDAPSVHKVTKVTPSGAK